MNDLRVSLVQASTIWHDAAANRTLYGDRVRELAGSTDLIVLPETFTSGFSNEAIGSAETMRDESVAWISTLAREVGAVVTGSMVIRDGERVFNRLLWARPDGSVAHYDKRHLFRMAGEHHRYADGSEKLFVDVLGWRVCPLVCYDLRFPVWSRNRLQEDGSLYFDVLLYVANWPERRAHHWKSLLVGRAIENQAYVIGVNRVGTDGNGITYTGDSVVLDPLGMTLVASSGQVNLLTATLDYEALKSYREKFPAWADADNFDIYG